MYCEQNTPNLIWRAYDQHLTSQRHWTLHSEKTHTYAQCRCCTESCSWQCSLCKLPVLHFSLPTHTHTHQYSSTAGWISSGWSTEAPDDSLDPKHTIQQQLSANEQHKTSQGKQLSTTWQRETQSKNTVEALILLRKRFKIMLKDWQDLKVKRVCARVCVYCICRTLFVFKTRSEASVFRNA